MTQKLMSDRRNWSRILRCDNISKILVFEIFETRCARELTNVQRPTASTRMGSPWTLAELSPLILATDWMNGSRIRDFNALFRVDYGRFDSLVLHLGA